MAITAQEETELKLFVAERLAAREKTRLLDLEHKRMAQGRAGLTAPENTELDAHLAAREAAAVPRVTRG
jgi:hypothetical protein